MIYQLDPNFVGFPNPEEAEPEGVIAVGGDLSVPWLLEAYCSGIFPWFEEQEMGPAWFCPAERMVLTVKDFQPHKSLQRVYRSGRFEVRVDTCFTEVMRACANTPRNYEPHGTWINEHFVKGYTDLFDQGYAHSFETFLDGRLVGGLYGVSIGNWFFGESMFHTETDASKVAFCRMVDFCRMHGLRYVDCQMETSHLTSLGARTMPRKEFLSMIYTMPQEYTLLYRWQKNTVVLLLGGNEGDMDFNLQMATAMIATSIGFIACESEVFETEPWGAFDEEEVQPFHNQAIIVDTDLPPHEVLRQAKEIEAFLGRECAVAEPGHAPSQERVYHSRPMDIDLIFYNNEVISTPELTIPHPRMQERRFVLDPLATLIPDYLHPTLKKTVSELREALL